MKIRVDFGIKSLNKILKWHWSTYAKHVDDWQWMIKAEFRGRPPQAKTKMKVRITSYRHNKLDYDNLVGGAKPLVDALKHLGLIVDDREEFLASEYHQIIANNNTNHTLIELEAA